MIGADQPHQGESSGLFAPPHDAISLADTVFTPQTRSIHSSSRGRQTAQIPIFLGLTTAAARAPSADSGRTTASATTMGIMSDGPEPLAGQREGIEVILQPRARARGQHRLR